MEICGEHGDEIAYSGRDCPACEHLEGVEKDLKEEHDAEVRDLRDEIEKLQDELDKAGE